MDSKFSFEPDEKMRWIYDQQHPDYHSEMARDLRKRREHAICTAPKWLTRDAAANDLHKLTPNCEGKQPAANEQNKGND